MSETFEDLSIPTDIGAITSGDITITGNISGQTVVVASGTYVQLPATQVVKISGATVSITSGQVVQLPATQVVNVSGQIVSITSGQTIQLPATQVVKVSGEMVVLASGDGAMTVAGAGGVVDAGIRDADAVWGDKRALFTFPYNIGYDADGNSWNRIRVNKSGQGALVVASSGLDHIVTGKYGKRNILFSGYGTTNTIVTSGFGFLQHERATISLSHLGGGSGINYNIIGHTMSGVVKYAITSGVIYSGDITVETISDPYEWIEVGADSTQNNFSGQVTVVAVRR